MKNWKTWALWGAGAVIAWFLYEKVIGGTRANATPAGGTRGMHTAAASQPTAPTIGEFSYAYPYSDANPDPLLGTYPLAGGVGFSDQ